VENKPNKIIWHHSGDASDKPQFLKIDTEHKNVRHFDESTLGYFGGYHYLIEKTGHVFAYRLETEVGSHDHGENIGSIGICLAGDFDTELPTPAQATALADLLENIFERWKFGIERVDPHRFGDTTNCPGLRLHDYWARIVYIEHKISWIRKLIWRIRNTITNYTQ